MSDWKKRLTQDLEPILHEKDPRPKISAYHDMPYAIFRYSPEHEFAVRAEQALLTTRLEQAGKRVTVISLAECMTACLEEAGYDAETIKSSEADVGIDVMIETIANILGEVEPLDEQVAGRLPEDADPERDIVFMIRAGALYPVYRTSALLEQLKGRVEAPAVLFYPGELDGAAGLKFMGVLDAEHNYRPKIF